MASAVTIRGFDYMTKRLMPTRENLRRVHRGAAMSEEDIAGVELMLYLIRAADVVRESVYSGLRERELSEGKFALLMTAPCLSLSLPSASASPLRPPPSW